MELFGLETLVPCYIYALHVIFKENTNLSIDLLFFLIPLMSKTKRGFHDQNVFLEVKATLSGKN